MDKKAGERYLTPWLFIILGIIGIVIVLGISLFYSFNINTNSEEADSLNLRLLNCIENNFKDVNENFNVFEKCGLDKNILGSGNFYFRISIPDKLNSPIEYGTKDLEMQCNLGKSGKQGDFPACSTKKLYYSSDKEYIIEIFSASNQKGGTGN